MATANEDTSHVSYLDLFYSYIHSFTHSLILLFVQSLIHHLLNLQLTPKKGLGSLFATVASAGRGLKRVGSAHNLAPPGSQSTNLQSKSLPPSPQQTPACSRKVTATISSCVRPFFLLGHLHPRQTACDYLATVIPADSSGFSGYLNFKNVGKVWENFFIA